MAQLITAIHDEEGEAWVRDFVNHFHEVMTCTRCCVTFRVLGETFGFSCKKT
jgi:hypothetical protein